MNDEKNIIDQLDQFVDRLVEEKGFENLTPEVRAQINDDLRNRLEDRINAIILEKLPPEKLEEFEKLVNTGNVEDIQAFSRENIPDLDQHIANELLAFRTTYI